MNDRCLFKAKRVDNGEWEIGNLIALPNGEYEIANKCLNPPDSDPMWSECIITHKVDPTTLCQCTGLKDKNGTLIWENDIVKDKSLHTIGKISYSAYDMRYMFDDIYDGEQCYTDDMWEDVEVIGNIFDNPELLEVEQ